jgi:hypothetical protein
VLFLKRQFRITKKLSDFMKKGLKKRALSSDVTPKKFWILCDSFGIHSNRTETSIEYAPDVINDHFATIVNDESDLNNSDIPTDTQWEGESFAFTMDDLRSMSILSCVSKNVELVVCRLECDRDQYLVLFCFFSTLMTSVSI